jgi:hypothetical protein
MFKFRYDKYTSSGSVTFFENYKSLGLTLNLPKVCSERPVYDNN